MYLADKKRPASINISPKIKRFFFLKSWSLYNMIQIITINIPKREIRFILIMLMSYYKINSNYNLDLQHFHQSQTFIQTFRGYYIIYIITEINYIESKLNSFFVRCRK